jgi:hypothetical protein
MNFECLGGVRSPGVFATFDTFKSFRSWACEAFGICSSADALSAGIAYLDTAYGLLVRFPAGACAVSFILAPSYTVFPPGKPPVLIKLVTM